MKITPRPFIPRLQSVQAIKKAENELEAKERAKKLLPPEEPKK